MLSASGRIAYAAGLPQWKSTYQPVPKEERQLRPLPAVLTKYAGMLPTSTFKQPKRPPRSREPPPAPSVTMGKEQMIAREIEAMDGCLIDLHTVKRPNVLIKQQVRLAPHAAPPLCVW